MLGDRNAGLQLQPDRQPDGRRVRARASRRWRRTASTTRSAAQPFASGMAAISTVLLDAVPARVRMSSRPPRCTAGPTACCSTCCRGSASTTSFVDMTDLDAVRGRDPRRRPRWCGPRRSPTRRPRSPTSPALAAICPRRRRPAVRRQHVRAAAGLPAAGWGADLVVHSATKYLGGHSDVTGGAVVGDVAAGRRGAGGAGRPRRQPRARRGVPAPPRPRDACRCGSPGTARPRSPSPRRSSTTPPVERIDYPGLAEPPAARARRASCSTPGRTVSGTAPSSRSRRAAAAPPGSRWPTRCGRQGRDQPRRGAHRGEPRGLDDAPPVRRRDALPRPASRPARCGSASGSRTPTT